MSRISKGWVVVGFTSLVISCIFVIIFTNDIQSYQCSFWISSEPSDTKTVHIAISCCGERNHEAAVLFKSAVLLTRTTLVFHIFTEQDLREYFVEKLDHLKQSTNTKFCYKFYDMHFPSSSSSKWRTLFAPCASQKLFMHNILTDINALLYVDTDVIFLSPPEDTWELLGQFNSTQFVGMAPEQLVGGGSWYDQFNDTLHYGPKGVNSGVLLLNLTYLRLNSWDDILVKFLLRFQTQVRLGDQDLLNIYFHFYPEQLYLAPCEYNYRSDYCLGNLTCPKAAKILHANRQLWHFPECNPFRAVYRTMKVQWDTNVLPYQVCTNLNYSVKDGCGAKPYIYVEELFKRFLPDISVDRDLVCK